MQGADRTGATSMAARCINSMRLWHIERVALFSDRELSSRYGVKACDEWRACPANAFPFIDDSCGVELQCVQFISRLVQGFDEFVANSCAVCCGVAGSIPLGGNCEKYW